MASFGDAENSSTVIGKIEDSYICIPCHTQGKKLKAVGYCVNCREYLCRGCFYGHLIPTPMKSHKLLDEEHMTEIETIDKNICLEHKDKLIEYHCPTHSFFGCSVCYFKHQKACKDVQFIPEVSENITNSEQYKSFSEKLTNIVTKCIELVTWIKGKTETTTAKNAEAVTAIREFKRDVLDALDMREKELIETADRAKEEETAQKTEVSAKCNAILMEAQTIDSTMEVLQNKQHYSDLYMTLIKSIDTILSLENELHTTNTKLKRKHFTFVANNDLLEMLKRPFGLGKLYQTNAITKVNHVQNVDVKSEDDEHKCLLRGSVLLPSNKLVIVDSNNAKLKLLDTSQNRVTAEFKFSSYTWGVCQVTEEQVAVTLSGGKMVAFVRTNPSLAVDRTVSVNGDARGVGYCDGKLVVSFVSPSYKVEVLDVQGTVLQKFETDENGMALFNYPNQLTVNPENKLIYVSNMRSHNVICMKLDGTVVAKYEDSELREPWQIAFSSNGTAFVCGRASHNIHQITEDCKKVKVLMTSANGLSLPDSISYSEGEGKLYIGSYSTCSLDIFQVSYATL